jgi:serine-type D-Ala-D-Ala endopeptidase (penicillin-binding protein 7)
MHTRTLSNLCALPCALFLLAPVASAATAAKPAAKPAVTQSGTPARAEEPKAAAKPKATPSTTASKGGPVMKNTAAPSTTVVTSQATKGQTTAKGSATSPKAVTASPVNKSTMSSTRPVPTAKASGKGQPTKGTTVATSAVSTAKVTGKGQGTKGTVATTSSVRTAKATGRDVTTKTRAAPSGRVTTTQVAYARPAPTFHASPVSVPVFTLAEPAPVVGGAPWVRSGSALVVDAEGEELFVKNPDVVLPIASITKLMTAMVVLDVGLPMDELITISAEDRDDLRSSHSRLKDGRATLSRYDLIHIALMSSENRAAAALARTTFPGGTPEFVRAMNRKAWSLGMMSSQFADGTGLDGHNVSTARDLVRMLRAAYDYPLIRHATTTESSEVHPYNEYRSLTYRNTNRLLRAGGWEIELSKTGYLNEAGRCLAMRTRIEDRPLYMVFLGAPGKQIPFEDSKRLRSWLESRPREVVKKPPTPPPSGLAIWGEG